MWATPGSSRPPPHTPGSPGLTTQSLRTIMVMMIWYWKYKGMSSGGPTARERERRGLERPVPPGGAGRWGGTRGQKPGCGASSVAPRQRRLEPWHPEKGAGSTRWHWKPECGIWVSEPVSLLCITGQDGFVAIVALTALVSLSGSGRVSGGSGDGRPHRGGKEVGVVGRPGTHSGRSTHAGGCKAGISASSCRTEERSRDCEPPAPLGPPLHHALLHLLCSPCSSRPGRLSVPLHPGPLSAPGCSGQHFLSPHWAHQSQAGLSAQALLYELVLPKLKLGVKSLPTATQEAGSEPKKAEAEPMRQAANQCLLNECTTEQGTGVGGWCAEALGAPWPACTLLEREKPLGSPEELPGALNGWENPGMGSGNCYQSPGQASSPSSRLQFPG